MNWDKVLRSSASGLELVKEHLEICELRFELENAQMVSSQFKFCKTATFWGWFFIVISSFFFLEFLFAAVISKFLPLSDNPILSAVQNDRYYCFLVPLTLPIIVVAVYFHWLSMKLFKHA